MERIKKVFGNYFLFSAVCVLLGVFFIANPDTIPKAFGYIVGGVIIAVGVVEIGRFLAAGNQSPVMLIRGIIFAAIGLFVILQSDFIYRILSVCMGTYMLASGLVVIVNALRVKKHDSTARWQLVCALGCITVVLGIVMLFTPLLPFVALGVILVISGVSNLFGSFSGKRQTEKVLGLPGDTEDGDRSDKGGKKNAGYIDVK
ncbi:MAG: DUF308 domain-containing protein [Ruminococcus sp.]|nr:DUF308 domain-containing protein [Ruminococcus sp.]